MQLPVQITFRDMDHSPAIENRIRQKVEKLEQFFKRITGCSVVIESPHRHHHKGKLYKVCVTLEVPDDQIVVNRCPSNHHQHEDIFVAIRDAFDKAKRQLQQYVDRKRGNVKNHATVSPTQIGLQFEDEESMVDEEGFRTNL